jgi:hypothetical protein
MRVEHLSLSFIKPLAVTALAVVISAAPAYAVDATDIHSFVSCLNSITSTNVADAVACVPAGCYTTVTLSQESGQPACTLKDGTGLPRVIFSCPGPGGSTTLRFRPSFTLCTQPSNLINHIEVGEDVHRDNSDDFIAPTYDMKMADIDSAQGFTSLTEIGTGPLAVDDTKVPVNSKGCHECHDGKGTVSSGPVYKVNLFGPIPPAFSDGIIYSNDPDPNILHPLVQTPLSTICTGISNSSKLVGTTKVKALSLCNALVPKI